LLGGTRTLVAVISFGQAQNCGVGYDFRLDTTEAQSFILSTLSSLGLSL
jgi:hypothetical protein